MRDCATEFNAGDGIQVRLACIVINNSSSNNNDGSAGIHVTNNNNRIEGNNVWSNERGIEVSGTGNLIIRNSASKNPFTGTAANYVIAAGNSFGAIVSAGTNASAVSGSSAASTLPSTDPWANFTY